MCYNIFILNQGDMMNKEDKRVKIQIVLSGKTYEKVVRYAEKFKCSNPAVIRYALAKLLDEK
jgi:hypothetical protein